MFIDINYIKNFQEYFKVKFKDLLNMEIPEWIISPFDVEVEKANLDTFLSEEFIEMTFDLRAKSKHIFKRIGYSQINKKKYRQL